MSAVLVGERLPVTAVQLLQLMFHCQWHCTAADFPTTAIAPQFARDLPYLVTLLDSPMSSSDDASLVALRRAEKISQLEARKAERNVARDTRRSEMETLRTTDGGTENVARSSDEFWSLFTAGERGEEEDIYIYTLSFILYLYLNYFPPTPPPPLPSF